MSCHEREAFTLHHENGPVSRGIAAHGQFDTRINCSNTLVAIFKAALLLQSPIRCYDEPSASGLAPRTLTVLLGAGAFLFGALSPSEEQWDSTAADVRASPQGSTRRSRDAGQRFRDEPS